MSAKRLPKIRAGRNLIVFYFRKNLDAVTAGTEERKTDTGTMKVSSAALTALDLLRYPQASGGIDSVVTVLADLAEKIDPEELAALSVSVERPVVQRLGHLLEHLGEDAATGAMLDALQAPGIASMDRTRPARSTGSRLRACAAAARSALARYCPARAGAFSKPRSIAFAMAS